MDILALMGTASHAFLAWIQWTAGISSEKKRCSMAETSFRSIN